MIPVEVDDDIREQVAVFDDRLHDLPSVRPDAASSAGATVTSSYANSRR